MKKSPCNNPSNLPSSIVDQGTYQWHVLEPRPVSPNLESSSKFAADAIHAQKVEISAKKVTCPWVNSHTNAENQPCVDNFPGKTMGFHGFSTFLLVYPRVI